jgi:hypothetical protein
VYKDPGSRPYARNHHHPLSTFADSDSHSRTKDIRSSQILYIEQESSFTMQLKVVALLAALAYALTLVEVHFRL